jgi:hypothetical protein
MESSDLDNSSDDVVTNEDNECILSCPFCAVSREEHGQDNPIIKKAFRLQESFEEYFSSL